MNEQQRAKWTVTRAKGKWRFVFLLGGFWAVGTTLLTPVLMYFIFDEPLRFLQFVIGSPIYAICGVVFGSWWWNRAERMYNQHK